MPTTSTAWASAVAFCTVFKRQNVDMLSGNRQDSRIHTCAMQHVIFTPIHAESSQFSFQCRKLKQKTSGHSEVSAASASNCPEQVIVWFIRRCLDRLAVGQNHFNLHDVITSKSEFANVQTPSPALC